MVRKVHMVGNSVRLLVVTTTRLVITDGGNSAWTRNTSYGNTTTSQGQSPLGGCQLEHTRSLEYSLNRLPRMGVLGNGRPDQIATSTIVTNTDRRGVPEQPLR
ncbi:hypothetical protein Taro_051941 [Colocasia esculenta]|uniref:Uncharacterized protein n=1 Tax=Colocasia esculenta TaxID=4460 RepID=A0A843XIA7_COLES|nr:hypothetical protein [Colocasia esculenta]